MPIAIGYMSSSQMSSRERLLKVQSVNYMGWEVKEMGLLTLLVFELLEWWPGIHFLSSLDSISIEGKVILWLFLYICLGS